MWPWGHLAFGYVVYSLVSRVARRRAPAWPAVAFLALGTQMPDLVDKPLAWTLSILPNGRSFAHSLIFGTLIAVSIVVLLRRLDVRGGLPFAVGYYSHLVGDVVIPVSNGDFADLAFLLWPVLPVPQDHHSSVSILRYILTADLTSRYLLEMGLAGLVGLWWLVDGAPGAAELWRAVRRRVRRHPN
ncbi:LexA-binding, inner membrane-associated putative hydrolase [Halopelagius inordinatus]|uniref:LexA-binding, inner membrane-associated putative hydrolase n=1 Tax=Halopelagius inordinatus TaxID=553467 RepID=A0A1I2U0A1_9EURY|nr:metal-dependent hydrolase [Halopelagius inordinatus]SFG70504.1 LexA-binding, inner membrane-associated putative hydrolase [Halopelagius inordinatus]